MKGTTGGLVGTAAISRIPPVTLSETPPGVGQPAERKSEEEGTRIWLGPNFWANRLQDWRFHLGRIECLAGGPGSELRTVAILTNEIIAGAAAAHLTVRTGLLEDAGGGGFCGFLIGAGGGKLDYRAAALVQRSSGLGGGIICTWETDGHLRFREHSDENKPLAFAVLPEEEVSHGDATSRLSQAEGILLNLDITPSGSEQFELKLSAEDPETGLLLASTRLRNVPGKDIVGGIALVSSPYGGVAGARFWFRDFEARGEKVAAHPDRALGAILGTLYSLNGRVLKVSAQFMPVGANDPQIAKFQFRTPGASWQDGPTAPLLPGFVALFRLDNWDASREWEYRITYRFDAPQPDYYSGVIRTDPVDKPQVVVGLFSCAAAVGRSLDGGAGAPELPDAEFLGRYTPDNFYFPHRELIKNARGHRADLLAFVGDQFYEGNPTAKDDSISPTLDYLYKWYLWLWAFREMTQDTPTIILVDDHDVYHGNLWGNGGRFAPERDQNRGGYLCDGEWVNLVQRTQCGHNPDPYDPTPVEQGITVYYGAFRYGGVSFAMLEDRKFKTAAIQGADLDPHESVLLGERQKKFLGAWAKDWEGASAKVCFTQTAWACLQTTPAGGPLTDFDSNGYPPLERDRAIELLREAGALLLAGDQHLATLVRHGIDTHTDGIVQLSGPACGTHWQRWFEPAEPLPNALDTPHTGDFKDAFGNKMRVLAVANPKISFKYYRKFISGRNQSLADRRLKSEGYGIVRIDRRARHFIIECWPWNVNPTAPGAQQFPGWPYQLRFDQCDGRRLT